jgi:ATP-dependent helicase/nuclease subunit A
MSAWLEIRGQTPNNGGRMSLTFEQTQAVQYNGSVLIAAGAGTGKTRVLAERLIHMLERGIRPREIVAVTFTEAAATELRSRVEAYLAARAEAAREKADVALLETVQNLRDELPEATISTIHSFAARIAREHPEASGAGLGFEVLDDLQSGAWLRLQLRYALKDLPEAVFQHFSAKKVFAILEILLHKPDSTSKALTQVATPSQMLMQWKNWLLEAKQQLWQDFTAERRKILATLEQNPPLKPDNLEPFRRAAIEILSSNQDFLNLELALEDYSGRIGSSKNWDAESLGAVRKGLAALKDFFKQTEFLAKLQPIDTALANALPALKDAYNVALARLDQTKLEAARLGFDDLLRAANRALASEEVRNYYAQRLKALLIDEFQDTTPSQWQMLRALVQPNLELTIVGDEKQSIYGFTGASPEVFREAEAVLKQLGGIRVQLSTSYRTHAPLVESINQTFEAAFKHTRTQFEALNAARPDNPNQPLAALEIHAINANRQTDAKFVAKRILGLVYQRQIQPRGETQPRAAKFKDIAILLRAFTDLDLYSQELEQHGIPFVIIGGRGLLARREIRDCIAMLRFFENPEDDFNLAIILRGLWFALPDNALLGIRDNAVTSWWAALPQTQPAIHTILKTLLETRVGHSADQLLLLADAATEFSASLAAFPDADRRLSNLEAFRAHLRTWNLSLPALRDHLDDLDAIEAELPEATPDNLDAITIISIHKSKGLEFPIVFLPDLARGSPPNTDGYRLEPSFGLAIIPDLTDYGKAQPLLYTLIDSAQKRHELEEKKRLLYVAATRAEDMLILSGAIEKTPEQQSAWATLSAHLPEIGVAWFTPDIAALHTPVNISLQQRQARAADPSTVLHAMPERLPITSLGVYQTCPQRFAWQFLNGLEPLERDWLNLENTEKTYSRATIGSLVHATLEQNWSETETEKQLGYLPKHVLSEVWELVHNARNGVFTVLSQLEWQREKAISVEYQNIQLEGIVDAHTTGWVLDYKTDMRLEPEHHLMQLSIYAKHFGATRASLAYLRHNVLYDYSIEDLERGQTQLLEMLSGIRAAQYTATPSSAACRFCAFSRQCKEAILERN